MRPVLHGDLDHAVRVLLAHPSAEWPGIVDDLIGQAQVADRFRNRTGTCHPKFGNGSLMSAAQQWRQGRLPAFCDQTYVAALQAVLRGLEQYRKGSRAA